MTEGERLEHEAITVGHEARELLRVGTLTARQAAMTANYFFRVAAYWDRIIDEGGGSVAVRMWDAWMYGAQGWLHIAIEKGLGQCQA